VRRRRLYSPEVARVQPTRAKAILHIIPFLFFGVLIGFAARLIAGGKGPPWEISMLIGAAGATLGVCLTSSARLAESGESLAFTLALLGAFSFVVVHQTVAARRRHA
jgi:uncharacterized membrane protein YeaQ/YmgE (transglycosylase-associated protein family)